MWNDDHRGREFLLKPAWDYLNLIDHDAKYGRYLGLPRQPKPDTSCFLIWKEQQLGKSWNARPSIFKHLHLIDLRSKSSDAPLLLTLSVQSLFDAYKDHVVSLMVQGRSTDMVQLFRKRIRVFRILKTDLLAEPALDRILSDMEEHSVAEVDLLVELVQAGGIAQQLKRRLSERPVSTPEDEWRSVVCQDALDCFLGPTPGNWWRNLSKTPSCFLTDAFFGGKRTMVELRLLLGSDFDLRPVPEEMRSDFNSRYSPYGSRFTNSICDGAIDHRTVVMSVLFRFVHLSTLRQIWEDVKVDNVDLQLYLPLPTSSVPPGVLANCLAAFWRWYPGPFMRREEFLKLAHDLYLDHLFFSRAYVETAFNVLEHLLPRKPCEQGPRSLLHLTRCALRKQLRRSRCIPEGVEELELPSRLKSYLLLEW